MPELELILGHITDEVSERGIIQAATHVVRCFGMVDARRLSLGLSLEHLDFLREARAEMYFRLWRWSCLNPLPVEGL